jgi:signal transduction histidine kinase
MAPSELVNRLAALPDLAHVPREELEWLQSHGRLEVWEAGTVVAPKGKRIEKMWIVVSGLSTIRVDRGAGPHHVLAWPEGSVTGMLPYSRMTGPPGDSYIERKSELLAIHESLFPEMIRRCPVFTAHTVHLMLDRARNFNTSDLQDEKMLSLGRLAAGLAHELNNPASATVRGSKLLLEALVEADAAARELGAMVRNKDATAAIERTRDICLSKPAGSVLSPIEQADREDAIEDWLERHSLNPVYAAPLAETDIAVETLEMLSNAASGKKLDAAFRWLAAGCATRSLAVDIEQAATRIYKLVAAVKNFTYMDKLAGSESVDIESGLRDTIRVVASKAKAKGASIQLDVAPDLPNAYANGGVLNQVWLNLIDNAIDAIASSGRVEIRVQQELDRIVVRVIDNGPGIPTDIASRVFDPFFTTKPPGQGTGLGLDIARRLLRRYQGDITFDSHPGRTEFRVNLLVEKPETASSVQDTAKYSEE